MLFADDVVLISHQLDLELWKKNFESNEIKDQIYGVRILWTWEQGRWVGQILKLL